MLSLDWCGLKAVTHTVALATAMAILASGCVKGAPGPSQDATELNFSEFFIMPLGPRELKLTEKLRSLDGKRVRILGYVVHQDRQTPGRFLFAPRPVQVHQEHYGLADDLPPSTVHVFAAEGGGVVVPQHSRPVLLSGRLSVGNQEAPDGRISLVRLTLDPRPGSFEAAVPAPREGGMHGLETTQGRR